MAVANRVIPPNAEDPTKCSSGGNHTPTTREVIDNGMHLKYKICTKCGFSLR